MRRRLAVTLAIACGTLAGVPLTASAATIEVTTTNDEYLVGGNCSLREAIDVVDANAAQAGCSAAGALGNDVIRLPSGSYELTRAGAPDDTNIVGDLDVGGAGSVLILPLGNGPVEISGGEIDRVFHHGGGGAVTLANLFINSGAAQMAADGGAVLNSSGVVNVVGSTFANNRASRGGAIANLGTVFVETSTIVANTSLGDGGGIYGSPASTTTLRSVTVSTNIADVDGNGIGDGGGFASTNPFNTFNTLIGDNIDSSPLETDKDPDCYAPTDEFFPRYTLVEVRKPLPCALGDDPGTNIFGQDPKLLPLSVSANAITPTQPLAADSPAIDKGGAVAPDACPETDQRFVARPQGPGCDIGAYERIVEPIPPVVPPVDPPVTPANCAGKTATKIGSPRRDVIRGTAKRDVIAALGGNDKITALGGNDLVCGGNGTDTISGGAGNDTLKGDASKDTLRGGAGKDVLQGASGIDRLFGGPAKDKLAGGAGKDTQKQ